MVVKSILILCLVQLGHNLQNPVSVQNLDYKTSYCVDYAAKCYYTKDDAAKCVAKAIRKLQGEQ